MTPIYKNEIDAAYAAEVGLKPGEDYWTIYCFTRAQYLATKVSSNHHGTCVLYWTLPAGSTSTARNRNPLPESRIHEIADKTEEVYSRSPIVRPLEVESDCS